MSEENLEIASHAAIYGTCTRISRTNHNARIELHDGTACTIQALTDHHTRKLTKEIDENPDQVYRIEGEATWSLHDYRISKLTVTAFRSVEREAGALFDALREATGGSFDGVDPIDYVNELRGK